MSEITVDKKLELMHQIRSRHERDRLDMSRREMIIYGATEDSEQEEVLTTFPARILLSVALFLLIVVSDLSGKSFWGINAAQCFQAIGQDYESSITAWVDAASESLVTNPE